MMTLVHFSHKNPLYDWHWIFFWLPSAENLFKTKEKKMPHYTKQESEKIFGCRSRLGFKVKKWWPKFLIDFGLNRSKVFPFSF
jgi:hypothetical protein